MTWDMWNQYHIIRGLLAWYEQTGNETAFQTAKKTADFIIDYFQFAQFIVPYLSKFDMFKQIHAVIWTASAY